MDVHGLTLEEAARYLGINRHTFRRLAVYRRAVGYFKLGRRLYFDPRELDEFRERHRVPAREESAR